MFVVPVVPVMLVISEDIVPPLTLYVPVFVTVPDMSSAEDVKTPAFSTVEEIVELFINVAPWLFVMAPDIVPLFVNLFVFVTVEVIVPIFVKFPPFSNAAFIVA